MCILMLFGIPMLPKQHTSFAILMGFPNQKVNGTLNSWRPSMGFVLVQLLWTHSNLPCRLASPFVTVVRGVMVHTACTWIASNQALAISSCFWLTIHVLAVMELHSFLKFFKLCWFGCVCLRMCMHLYMDCFHGTYLSQTDSRHVDDS